MGELHVELVAADRKVWSGDASMLLSRTTDGELGILPGHAPLLGVLVEGEVRIVPTDGQALSAEIGGGFLSVDHDRVVVVAELVNIGEHKAPRPGD